MEDLCSWSDIRFITGTYTTWCLPCFGLRFACNITQRFDSQQIVQLVMFLEGNIMALGPGYNTL